MRNYLISIVLLCTPALCTSNNETETTDATNITSAVTTIPYDPWPRFVIMLDPENGRQGHTVSSFEKDYFNREGMCPISQTRLDTGQCRDLGQIDFILGVESSWYVSFDHCDAAATNHAHSKIAMIIDHIVHEMHQTLNFSRGHRLGAYFADKNVRTLKSLCVNNDRPFSKVEFPTSAELKFNENGENPNTFLELARKIDGEMKNCPRLPNKTVIIYLFLQKMSEANFWSREVQDFFKLLAEWRSQKIRVFLITVNDCAFNFLNKKILHEPTQYKVLMGHMAINSYEAAIDRVTPALAEFIVRCSCRRADECLTEELNRSKCHFANKDGRELCHRNVNWKILSQPDRVSCATNGFLNCTFEECMADCNLKGWQPWTSWRKSREFETDKYIRNRRRLSPAAGSSEFTKNCEFEEEQQFCAEERCHSDGWFAMLWNTFASISPVCAVGFIIGIIIASTFISIISKKKVPQKLVVSATGVSSATDEIPSTSDESEEFSSVCSSSAESARVTVV